MKVKEKNTEKLTAAELALLNSVAEKLKGRVQFPKQVERCRAFIDSIKISII